MKSISVIKRFLLYIPLFSISLIMAMLSLALLREFAEYYLLGSVFIFSFLIPYYIFGLFFLKTRLIYKFIVPFLNTIIVCGTTFLSVLYIFSVIPYDIICYLIYFIIVAYPWEIAYYILRRHANSKS
jgi:hypothetical protein